MKSKIAPTLYRLSLLAVVAYLLWVAWGIFDHTPNVTPIYTTGSLGMTSEDKRIAGFWALVLLAWSLVWRGRVWFGRQKSATRHNMRQAICWGAFWGVLVAWLLSHPLHNSPTGTGIRMFEMGCTVYVMVRIAIGVSDRIDAQNAEEWEREKNNGIVS